MDIINRNDVITFTTKDSSTIRELVRPETTAIRRQSLAEAVVLSGQSTHAHYHAMSEEIYYVVQGRGLMAIEYESRDVGVGDAIVIPPGKRHQIRNIGTVALVILCCCAPAYLDEDTVLCSSLLM